VRLTIVGCAGSFPGPNSAASSYLVESDGFTLVLDLGNGAIGSLARHTDIYRIDAIALSHLHADHCLDLCPYYVARHYHRNGPFAAIPVFGPPETERRIARAYGTTDNVPNLAAEFDFRTYPDGEFSIGPFRTRVALMDHPVTTFAIRIEHNQHTLVYSGDTGPTDALAHLAKDSDILLCEATFREGDDNPPRLHMTGYEAGQHASKAGARHLVLTHVPPWVSTQDTTTEARESFDGAVDLAVAGATYDL
jgi:ribonuclease BN (tRNA processing enzyme)